MTQSAISRFYRELKRRKVIRVAIVYAIVAWLVVEIASVMFPGLLLPEWSVRLVIGLAIIGMPIALVLSWAVDVTPEGIKFDSGESESADSQEFADGERTQKGSRQDNDRSSVAVLPFLNLSSDPENEYFSDGMSEELLNLLCKLPQLTVASRTSSFSFKGKDVDLGTVAKKLDVDVILEGSVRRSGDRVRITAQLIDGRSDRHLWSETYDRELKDVFAVQDEIAGNIVAALKINLTPAQQRSIGSSTTTDDMDAYDFYLRGRHYFERKEVNYAIQMFEKATEQDPDYARAWAGAAESYAWKCMWYEETPEDMRAAQDFSRKALQLEPNLAEAHAAHGLALSMNGEHAEAEKEYEVAIELDPQLFRGYYYAGRLYFTQGKFREAANMFAKASAIRPDDVAAASLHSTSLRTVGTEEEKRNAAVNGARVAEQYIALNPDDSMALSRGANDLIYIGQIDKGLEWAERAYSINPVACRYNVACSYILAGEKERALDLLDECSRSKSVHLEWVEQDDDWDAVRDDRRFKRILERLAGK